MPSGDLFDGRFGPNRTLQVYPDIVMYVHRVKASAVPEHRGDVHDPTVAPLGPRVAILVGTGASARRVHLGGRDVDMGPHEELLLSAVDLRLLAESEALELRVHRLDAMPTSGGGLEKVRSRGRASRITRWGAVREAEGLLADGKRALRLAVDSHGRLIMDWWHTTKAPVFFEVDDTASTEGFVRAVLTRDGVRPSGPDAAGWYQADQTPFEVTSG